MATIKDLKRMCKNEHCEGCPLDRKGVSCMPDSLPDNADEIVDKWVAEHPVKTYAMDFFKKFPDAPHTTRGYPVPCIGSIYSGFRDKKCLVGGCFECWNQEMKGR